MKLDNQKILQLYKDNILPPDIGKILNVGEDCIRRRLKKMGQYKSPILENKISDFDKKLRVLHELGFSATKISILLGTTTDAIINNLRRRGLQTYISGKDKFRPELSTIILSLYNSGKNQTEISKLLGVSRTSVKLHLNKLNVKTLSARDVARRDANKRIGINNPNYRHGNSTLNESVRASKELSDWKQAIFQRDNFRCVSCNNKNKRKMLHAHHLFLFSKHPDLRFSLDNGLTLCDFCHKLLHNTVGYKDTNKDEILEILRGYK